MSTPRLLVPVRQFKNANSSNFAATQGLYKDTATLGITVPEKGFLSAWVKPTSGSGALMHFISGAGVPLVQLLVSTTTASIGTLTKTSAITLYIGGSVNLVLGKWNLVAFNWDFNAPLLQCYANGVVNATFGSSVILGRAAATKFFVGAGDGSISPNYRGDLSELVYLHNINVDLTNPVNIRKLVTSSNRPTILGSTGTALTGSQPLIYLTGSGNNFNINSGSGGNLSIGNGPLTIPSTTPSLP